MKKILSTLTVISLLLISSLSYCQKQARTITGIVTSLEDGGPLEGVTIKAKPGKKISGTQSDGIYYIAVDSQDSVLVISYPEFKTLEIRIGSSNEYNVALQKKGSEATSTFQAPFALGKWKAYFKPNASLQIPFNFIFKENDNKQYSLYFINGNEQFFGGTIANKGDSIYIALDAFDNELIVKQEEGKWKGFLRRQDHTGTPLLFEASPGEGRFEESGLAPSKDFSGTYDIIFSSPGGKEEKAVGIFKQEGKKLQVTFLRITGDSRYLEGIVEGNNYFISGFIGSGPSFYKGSFLDNDSLSGATVSIRGNQPFKGKKNEKASLPDPYKLTYLKEGYSKFEFSFPDVNGKLVSLSDPKYKGKVVIVTIGGTWCPNCIDEAAFFAPWYKKNANRGVEIITLQYERQTDTAYVRKVFTRFRNRFDIQYDQLIAGVADKQVVANSLPALNTFLSFPTTIIINKKGEVAQIHTGFSGPATGKYYDNFITEFNDEIDKLLRQ